MSKLVATTPLALCNYAWDFATHTAARLKAWARGELVCSHKRAQTAGLKGKTSKGATNSRRLNHQWRIRAGASLLLAISGLAVDLPSWAVTTCTPGSGYNGCLIFNYTGADQTFTVPLGATSINVKAWGAGGGGPDKSYYSGSFGGGGGGYVTGNVAVSPGAALTVTVGRGGAAARTARALTPSFGGGGAGGQVSGAENATGASGGGFSAVWTGSARGTLQLLAGGGGGSTAGADSTAGGGGGATGGSGPSTSSGQGGTQSAGGAAASQGTTAACGAAATAGSYLTGGTGAGSTVLIANRPGFSYGEAGGGGGGGYYGGGGGSCETNTNTQLNGGGGGGSSYIGGAAVSGASTLAGSNSTANGGGGAPGNSGDSLVGSAGTGSGDVADAGDGLVVLQFNAAYTYWDTTPNNGSVDGGSGIWDAATSNWTIASGLPNGTWAGGANIAMFQGSSPGTVTVNGTQSIGGLTFGVNGYTLTGGTALSLAQNSTITTPSAGSATIATPITGGYSLNSGGGTTQLTGANTYTGNTGIDSGTLQIGGSGSLGSGGYGGTIANSGTLQYSSSATQTLSGVISGAGALVKDTATSTLTLSNANTYTGATTISAGTLIAANANALGTVAGSTTVADGASLGLSGGITTLAEPLTLNGTGVSSAGALYNVSGSNTFAGPITLGSASSIANNVSGTTLTAGGTVATAGYGLTLDGSSSISMTGVMSGTGSLTKTGSGTATLNAMNTYTGATTVSAGTLQSGIASSAFSSASPVTVANGATLLLSSSSYSEAIGSLAGAGSVTALGATPTLTIGSLGTSTTFSGVISGIMALTKTGAGTLTLSGANTYTGATTISNGTLMVTGSTTSATTVNGTGAVGGSGTVGGATTIGSGGTLSPGAGTVGTAAGIGTLSFGYTLTLQTGSYTNIELGQAGTVGGSYNDLVSVNGTVTLGGTLTVTASSGGTFGVGTYRLFNCANLALGSFSSIVLPAGYTGTVSTTRIGQAGQVNLVVALAPRTYWDGPNTTANSTADGGNGTWDSTTTNWTTPDGAGNGVWPGGTSTATFTGAVGNVTVNGAQSIGGLTFVTSGYSLTAGTSASLAMAQSSTITTPSSGLATIAVPITGGTSYTLTTSVGTTALTGTNTYSGATAISSGTLQIGGSGSLGSGSYSGTIANTGTLQYSSSAAQTLSGVISGAGALVKDTATSTLTLSNANTYTGATTISAGTLIAANANALGTVAGSTTVADGASLGLSGSITTLAEPLTLNGTGLSSAGALYNVSGNNNYAGAITLGSASTIANNVASTTLAVSNVVTNAGFDLTLDGSSALALSGNITGTGGVVKTGTGTATLSSSGSVYTGATTINAGTLITTNASALGSSTVTVKSGGSLGLSGNFANPVRLNGAGAGGVGALYNASSSNSFSGAITLESAATIANNATGTVLIMSGAVATAGYTLTLDNAANPQLTITGVIGGSGGVTKTGVGTVYMNVGQTYTGPTRVSAGTLQAGTGTTAFGQNSAVTVENGGTLYLPSGYGETLGSLAGAGSVSMQVSASVLTTGTDNTSTTFSGVISGAGALTKTGTGTQTLSGANTYTGATTVSNGTLMVTGSTTSAATVNGTGTLAGSGTVGGASIVASGGTLSPGAGTVGTAAGIGTLSFGSSLTLQSGSYTNIELGQAGTGVLNDLVAVSGSLTLAGTLTVTTSSGGTFGPGTYRLFNCSGTATGSFSSIVVPTGYTATVSTATTGQVNLVVAAIPRTNWDGSYTTGNGTIDGGNGTWDSTTNNWTSADGLYNGPWAGGSSTATFGGATGTVTVNGAQSIGGLTFTTDNYVLAAGTSASLALAADSTITTPGSGKATIGTAITGAHALTIMGGTTVLTASSSYSLGTLVKAGATLSSQLPGTPCFLSALGTGPITVEATAFLKLSTTANQLGCVLSYAGNGPSALTIQGELNASTSPHQMPATVTLNGGTVSYTGTPNTTYGSYNFQTVAVTADSVISAGRFTIGTFNVSNGVTLDVSGYLNGSATLSGGGKVIFRGADNVGGGVLTVNAGTVQVGNGGNSGSVNTHTSIALATTSTLLSFNRSDTYTLSTTITGNGNVSQDGTGTTKLGGTNTYTGSTTVNGGTLQYGVAGGIPAASTVTVNSGTLDANNISSISRTAATTVTGTLALGDGSTGATTITLGGTNVTHKIANITGKGTITVSSGATLELTGSFTDTDLNIVLAGGKLLVDASKSVGIGTLTQTADSTVDLDATGAATLSVATLTLNTGTKLSVNNWTSGSDHLYATSITGNPAYNTLNLIPLNQISLSSNLVTLTYWANSKEILLRGAVSGYNNWDTISGNGQIDGGSGDWSSTAVNWSDSGATINGLWSGTNANFGGQAGNVNVVGQQYYSGLNFTTSGYVLTTTASSAGTLASTTNGTAIVVPSSGNVTLDVPLTGLYSLVFSGGTSIITANSTASGSVTVYAGTTLQIGNGGAIGDLASSAANPITLNTGATLAFSRSDNYTFSRVIAAGGSGSTAGTVLQQGGGMTTLSGANGFSTAAQVTAGVLQYGVAGAIPATTPITVTAGKLDINDLAVTRSASTSISGELVLGSATGKLTLSTGSGAHSIAKVSGTGTIVVNTGTVLTLTGSFNDAGLTIQLAGGTLAVASGQTVTVGAITQTAASILDLSSGAATLTVGTLTISSGTLAVNNWTAGTDHFYATSITGSPSYNTLNVAPLNQISLGGASAALTYWASSNSELLLGTAGSYTWWDNTPANNQVDGGTGTWNATNTNWSNNLGTFNGAWAGGTNIANFGGTGGVVTVDATTAQSAGGLNFTADGYSLTGGTLSLGGTTNPITVGLGASATIASAITGGNALTKEGVGALTLSGAIASRAVSVNAGALTLSGSGNSLVSVTVGGGAAGASLTHTGSLTLTDKYYPVVVGASATDTASSFTNAGTLYTPVLILGKVSGANGTFTQTGGLVSVTGGYLAGAFQLTVGYAASSTGTYNMQGGTFTSVAFLAFGHNGNGTMNQTGGSLTGHAWVSIGRNSGSVGTYNISAGTLVADSTQTGYGDTGIIVGEEGTGTLTISGSGAVQASKVFWFGHDTGRGTVNLNGGTLTVPYVSMHNNVAATGGATGTFNFNGGTLKANGASTQFMWGLTEANVLGGGARIDDGGYAITIPQVLQGTGALTKQGTGTLTLSGANTYSGSTTVSAGALLVTGSTASSSAVNVPGGATLGGTGTVGGAVTVAGTLRPGTSATAGSAGTLTTGRLSFSNGGVLALDLGPSGTTGGGVNDLVQVNGDVDLTNATLTINALSGFSTSGSYVLMSYTGTRTGTFASNNLAAISYLGLIQYDDTNKQVKLVSIPRVHITQVSNGGIGTFSYVMTGLDTGSVQLTTATAGSPVTSATYSGSIGTAATLAQSVPLGWPATPSSVSCVDASGASNGNGTGSLGTVSGVTVTLTAAQMRAGADITCTFTNTNNGIAGVVFNDGGAPSGGTNTGTPNDGLRNGSEQGISGVTVSLTNCAGTTYASSTTDGGGAYSLAVPTAQNGQGVCVVVSMPNSYGYIATGANVGGSNVLADGSSTNVSGTAYSYTRSARQVSFTAASTGQAVINFGEVKASTLTPTSSSRNAGAGVHAVHAHSFTAGTGGSLALTLGTATATPSTLTGWSEIAYLDPGCTGTVQQNATRLYPSGTAQTVTQGQVLCFVVQELVPAIAGNGNSNAVPVTVTLTLTNAAPALTATYLATDTTTASTSAVALTVEVRNVTQGGSFSTGNQAKPGEVLEYRITYANTTPSPVTSVVINESTPTSTTFVSAQADTTPTALGSCTKSTPANTTLVDCATAQTAGGTGTVSWHFGGTLPGGTSGTVLYRVKVD